MTLASAQRIIFFAWQSFYRNIWLSLVTISIIVLTFISINFLLVVNIISDQAIAIVQDKVDVSIFFKPDITESQVFEVQSFLTSLPEVNEIEYVSQQEALDAFKLAHLDNEVIIQSLEELDENPIGATLQIKANNIEEFENIVSALDNSQYNNLIAERSYEDHKTYIEKIESISENVKKFGWITSAVFVLIALLIVFNTIRVAIYTHRQEIAIMKLVGATNWFIRSPFLLEAVMYGVVACLVAVIIVYPTLNVIQPYVTSFFLSDEFNIAAHFRGNFWQIFGLELLIVILLNIISSSIATRRYLKV